MVPGGECRLVDGEGGGPGGTGFDGGVGAAVHVGGEEEPVAVDGGGFG